MKILDILKAEFAGFSRREKIFFPLIIVLICIVSLKVNDSLIALAAAVSGIICTLLSGKGRVSSYYFGISGTLCYAYSAFIRGFYGNFLLNALYYLPMEVIGIFRWKKHLKKEIREIKKARLSNKERILYGIAGIIFCCVLTLVFYVTGGKHPVFDAFTTGLAVLGQFLTVNRRIEQWHIWFIADLLSLFMWLVSYLETHDGLAFVLMRLVYTSLAVYFYFQWKKELASIPRDTELF